MRPDLVIFDCDGVLVDSERLTVGVEARVLTELGWPHTAEEVVARWMGRTSEDQLAELEARLGPGLARRFDEVSTQQVRAAFERELVGVSGVVTLLDVLDAHGTQTCVASSGSHEKMRLTLRLCGLHDRFRGRIFSASEVRHGKPAPDLFLHAAASMGVPTDRTAVVEDSVYGVQAAVRAGMAAYGFAGGLSAPGTLAAAGATEFQEMADLAVLLDHSEASIA
jgi:HAD superfamily hydrolase (TIGR01509 family)